MTVQILRDILARFPDAHVGVIGDVMLDQYIYGATERISPESPVPVLSVREDRMMLGGAGNVVANLHAMGVQTSLITVVGDDQAANDLMTLLEEKKISSDTCISSKNRMTTIKTRYLASNQQLLRVDRENTNDLSEEEEDSVLEAFDKLINSFDALIVSDYGKGVLTLKTLSCILDKAQKENYPVFVDPKGNDYSRYRGATYITPNLKELGEAAGYRVESKNNEVEEAAQSIMKACGVHNILATRSKDGMSLISAGSSLHMPTEALDVYDVSGAGDTVIATLAAAIAAKAEPVDAVKLANIAGGIVVAKIGTASVYPEEFEEYLEQIEMDEENADVFCKTDAQTRVAGDWQIAKDKVALWKRKGLKVGFTNGCFDILHSGHTTYLAEARQKCDRLVLGLNADESVRRLKGATRPVNDQNERAAVLAALSSVDMVVIFGTSQKEDDKPVQLIKALQPDIFFKGGDYTEEQLPEAPVVRSYGGDVCLMSVVDGVSTTSTIQKIERSK